MGEGEKMNKVTKGSIRNPIHERKRKKKRKSLRYQAILKKIAERKKIKNYVI